MTKEQFLQSTIDYYSVDPETRRCYDNHSCMYSPKNAGKGGKSEGCAIGRHLSPETQQRFDNLNGGNGATISDILTDKNETCLLPKWMQEMDSNFLLSVQKLHDKTNNWDGNGLSSIGKERVNYIIQTHNLSVQKFEI